MFLVHSRSDKQFYISDPDFKYLITLLEYDESNSRMLEILQTKDKLELEYAYLLKLTVTKCVKDNNIFDLVDWSSGRALVTPILNPTKKYFDGISKTQSIISISKQHGWFLNKLCDFLDQSTADIKIEATRNIRLVDINN